MLRTLEPIQRILEQIPFIIRLVLLCIALAALYRFVVDRFFLPNELPPTPTVTPTLTATHATMPSYTRASKQTSMPPPTAASMLTEVPTTTPLSGSTPTPTEEVVIGFLVLPMTPGERTPSTVKPDATITLTVQEIVQITATLSTSYEEQEKGFVFTWFTCRTGSSPVLKRIDNPEMLYIAPSEPVPDCICVVVEKGGETLDRQKIFVGVRK